MGRNYNNFTGFDKRYNFNYNYFSTKINPETFLLNCRQAGINNPGITSYGSDNYHMGLLFNHDTKTESAFHSLRKNIAVINLTESIINNLGTEIINSSSKKIFRNEFYTPCLDELIEAELFRQIDDIELLLLFLKQLSMILRESDIFSDMNEWLTEDNSSVNSFYIYVKIFDSFWNRVNWGKLFPSMPEFAQGIQKKRKIIFKLLQKEKAGKFRIDRFCNSLVKMTGLGKADDIYLISFFDFYIFTWLSHFGLFRYLNGNDHDPVMLEFTSLGRILLKQLPF